MTRDIAYHVPVMRAEILHWLEPMPGNVFVDATLGGGGHAQALAERIAPGGVLIGIDRDPDAITAAQERFSGGDAAQIETRIVLRQASFDQVVSVLADAGHPEVEGVLMDLGVSSHQLDEPERGFSFKDPDAPLDMRMAQDGPTAADLLNEWPEDDLTKILRDYADEKWAARIAQFIGQRRAAEPYRTTGQLVETVKAAIPVGARSKDIHPATRTFQALRIAVNDEFGQLERGLDGAVRSLRQGGRCAVLSYHSGEDRIVKQAFGIRSGQCQCPPERPVCDCGAATPLVQSLTRKPLTPSLEEIAQNPRARSAKLRVVERR